MLEPKRIVKPVGTHEIPCPFCKGKGKVTRIETYREHPGGVLEKSPYFPPASGATIEKKVQRRCTRCAGHGTIVRYQPEEVA
jgi:RecJ-like exonuclease